MNECESFHPSFHKKIFASILIAPFCQGFDLFSHYDPFFLHINYNSQERVWTTRVQTTHEFMSEMLRISE